MGFFLKTFKILPRIIVTMLVISMWNIFATNTNAQESVSQSFGVDPLKISTSVSPEALVEVPIKVYNLKNTEMYYLISLERFEVKGQKGEILFKELGGIDTKKEPQISFSEIEVSIPANSSKTIIATISAENQVPAKEFFYTIFITPVSSNAEVISNVTSVQGKIGILTFINVVKPGEILGELIKSGSIVEFNTSRLNFLSPVQFSAIINNTGTIHYDAYGTIEIYNKKNQLSKTISLKKATVLPGATRILESTDNESLIWDFGYRFGKYKAVLNVKSVDGTLNMNEEIEFLVIPIMPVLILLSCIAGIIGFIFVRKKVNSLTNKKE